MYTRFRWKGPTYALQVHSRDSCLLRWEAVVCFRRGECLIGTNNARRNERRASNRYKHLRWMGQYDAHRNNCSLSGSITRQAGNMKYNLSLAASGQDEVVAVGGGLTSFALDTQTNTLYGAAQDDGKGLTFISFDVTSRTSTVKALHGRTFTFTLALTTPTPTFTPTLKRRR